MADIGLSHHLSEDKQQLTAMQIGICVRLTMCVCAHIWVGRRIISNYC